mmetsp:Transcript_26270/g.36558  ORF Transcript_26270/g.36558 Transcript_26270/m.36558 type:complete len:241 (-) Transcript_26270:198-920(-)|eukprot:CAMPEP_0201486634 /NCGR_PEP_ID=MMETSP0151_2-20130828/10693_1 /ASSEMBLY_ACC=CAM_ASM_000257 /TAXON_ID=200890 /ORGANISM="Paramoeba atlantica, Strain 621/1 / CCAP 1560/9" /LENGTH=240 /DNA_ID=CAMNT_0047871381 /DNA_START=51 /DNA_END=773 /DNA_ORIENTATION=+
MDLTVSQALSARISTRRFLKDRVPEPSLIATLLQKAARSPSGGNTQPWHTYVLYPSFFQSISNAILKNDPPPQEASTKYPNAEYSVYPPPEASKVYMQRRRAVAYEMYKLLGVDRKDKEGRTRELLQNFALFGAPVGIAVCVDRIVDRNGWGHVGMFLMSLCLLAEEAGLKTCLQESWADFSGLLREKLEIPEDQVFWCVIAIGYEDPSAPVNTLRTERAPLSDFCKFYGVDFDPPSAKL